MNWILLEPSDVTADGGVRLDDVRARHVREVLHGAPGDVFRAGILDGPLGRLRVETLAGAEVVAHFEPEPGPPPPRPPVDLLLALPRPKVLKRLWAPLAALGVGTVHLTNAAKVERMYFDTHVLDPAFYRTRLIEGLQQAGDTRLPEVRVHRRLKVWLEDELPAACPGALKLAADPAATESLGAALRDAAPADRLLLAVGPEGGWTDYERELLARAGFVFCGLGPRILRSDTAALVLLGLAHEAWRERCPSA